MSPWLLFLMACTPDPFPKDTSEDPDTAPDSATDTGVPCVDFMELIDTCEERVRPTEGSSTPYYDGLDTAGDLLSQLHALIDNHESRSFDSLWDLFPQTDPHDDMTVWDVYSNTPGQEPAYSYDFESDRCGDYQGEGDCYNREHTWPSSWFGGGSPMKSDLFHVRPTDGYVNNRRGNRSYGVVLNARWTSTNGSKIGPSHQCGYSREVFEPRAEFKGDLARGLFYMATRYRGEDQDWASSDSTDGATLEPWAEILLKAWHIQDPVDEREQSRNEAVFALQGNRNPFIDHPEWVCTISDF